VELAAKNKLDVHTLTKWGEGEMMYFSRDAPSAAIDGACVCACACASVGACVCLSASQSVSLCVHAHSLL